MQQPLPFVLALCAAEIASMAGTMFFPALLPLFKQEWGISNTAAGWINGIFFAGYALASPFLVALTDRIDPRRIYLPAALISSLALFLFGTLAGGTWSAALLRLLAGIGLAGTYMPGLKILSDQVRDSRQSRYVVFYTASYGIGTALSVWLAGFMETLAGWRMAAMLLSLAPLMTILIAAWSVPAAPLRQDAAPEAYRLAELRAIWGQRNLAAYVVGYGVHCWELFGFRSWLVAFLAATLGMAGAPALPLNPQSLAMLILLVGVPATIFGNERALRGERRATIRRFMSGSGLVGCLVGFAAAWHPGLAVALCFVYGAAVMTDSGAITAGLVADSPIGQRGLALAIYSSVGFAMAFLAPLVFGMVLDVAGHGALGWGLAFAALGLPCLVTAHRAFAQGRGSDPAGSAPLTTPRTDFSDRGSPPDRAA